jgi:hypothetical protein
MKKTSIVTAGAEFVGQHKSACPTVLSIAITYTVITVSQVNCKRWRMNKRMMRTFNTGNV